MLSTLTFASLLFAQPAAQPAAPAPDPVTPEQAKKVVERSLPFLREEGIQWSRRRQCISCHHVGFMVWSLGEAQRHNLKVDAAELKYWTDWAVRYARYDGTFYQLGDPAIAALQKESVDDDTVAKLKNVKQVFVTLEDFRDELKKSIPGDALKPHHDLIVKTSAKPGQGGKGEDSDAKGLVGPGTVASELLLGGAAALSAAPGETSKALVERLVVTQRKDGSWIHGGQFNALNRPGPESTEAVTAWNALALIGYDAPSEAAAATRDRALTFLKKAKPGVSTDSIAVHALLAHALKDAERRDALVKDLRDQQNPDGGWSWLTATKKSDAWATGEVLYTLGTTGVAHTDPAVQRGWSWLAKTQREDGDWFVGTADIRKGGAKRSTDPIFTYWGTAWAAIGIMKTLPK